MSTNAQILDGINVMAFLAPKDRVRLMREGDVFPPSLEAGFDLIGNLDREWIWVVESNYEIVGVLIAAPCHGVAFIWRLTILPGQKQTTALALLRRFVADIESRGMKGYLTIVDQSVPLQSQLKGIIEKHGGQQSGGDYALMACPLGKEGM